MIADSEDSNVKNLYGYALMALSSLLNINKNAENISDAHL